MFTARPIKRNSAEPGRVSRRRLCRAQKGGARVPISCDYDSSRLRHVHTGYVGLTGKKNQYCPPKPNRTSPGKTTLSKAKAN
ncbi:unnamed protein product, partial [Brenthis ino]